MRLKAAQSHHAKRHIEFLGLNHGVLQLGLFRQGVEGRHGEHIGAAGIHVAAAPMHGHERLTGTQFVTCRDTHGNRAALRCHAHHVTIGEPAQRHVVRVHREQRRFGVVMQPRDASTAAHAVPLIAQPPGIEMQRIARVGFFRRGLVYGVDKTRTA